MLTKLFPWKKYRLLNFDFFLVVLILALSLLGSVILRSATVNFVGDTTFKKQLMGIVIGTIAMLILSVMDYHVWMKFWYVFYAAAIGILVLTRLIGTDSGAGAGAKRWIVLPVIGQIQPSEFVKIALILFVAGFYMMREDVLNSAFTVVGSVLLAAVPILLVFLQPNLSTTIIIVVVFAGMVFAAGISYKWIVGGVAGVAAAGGVFLILLKVTGFTFLRGYMMNRIRAFLNGGSSAMTDLNRQQMNSVMAIGSGGLTGKGLFNSTFESVKNGNYLTEEDCDFIFAVVGEELGFIGCCVILGLILLIVLRLIRLAASAQDLGGRLICSGMAVLLTFQTFVNIGVATHLLPNTGVPLPFVSAGLSSLLGLFLGMGVVLNVALQRRTRSN